MSAMTKIVATLGPSLNSFNLVTNAILNGVEIFRQPFGYRKQNHLEQFRWVHQAKQQIGSNTEVMIDLPSDRLRLGELYLDTVLFKKKQIVFIKDTLISNSHRVLPIQGINKYIPHIAKGDVILLKDGTTKLTVVGIKFNLLICEVEYSTQDLKRRNNVLIINELINYNLFTQEDEDLLKLYNNNNLTPDWIAISFIKSRDDLHYVKDCINSIFGHNNKIKIMAKIETKEALKLIDDIVKNTDGVMIARGDLGLVIPIEQLPYYQTKIITIARKFNKVVIVATQLLEQYADTGIPNRSEVNDLAMAVKQKASGIMLSRETSGSNDPIDVICMAKKIIDFYNKCKIKNTQSIKKFNYPIIALEGIDGAGKTTISQKLAEEIDGIYIQTPPSDYKAIRDFFEIPLRPIISRFFFYIGSLWESWEEIQLAAKTKPVIIDRYILSTKIYHKALASEKREHIDAILSVFEDITPPEPNLNIYLNCSSKVSMLRLKRRKQVSFDTNIEHNRSLQLKIAEMFLEEDVCIVDTNNCSIEEVVEKCKIIIKQNFSLKLK